MPKSEMRHTAMTIAVYDSLFTVHPKQYVHGSFFYV